MKETGFERKNEITFLRLFDNPLSKYFTFKIISCMQWLFWVIYQNYRGLGLAFAAHFLHDFSIKMFFIWYSIYGQVSMPSHFSFSRYQTKCVIEFLFWQLMASWTLRFIFDHSLKQWPTDRKKGKDRNTKIWISQEQKEPFRWNKKHFS